MSFKIPILFQFFNRLDTSLKIFSKIKEIRPLVLFIVQDGARKDKINELEECLLVRHKILEQIDWGCKLVTYFRDENIGPGAGPGDAIKWFFDQVEYGIVLEHDCLPNTDFFEYCRILLEKYKNENRVMLINGSNYQNGKVFGTGSYYFCVTGQIWGWAAWKRTFINYEYDIKKYSKHEVYQNIKHLFKTSKEQEYWEKIYTYIEDKKVETWDYQLLFSIWNQNGLILSPNVNLVSNIGFGNKSIHCKDIQSPLSNAKTFSILPLQHPSIIKRNLKSDRNYLNKYLISSLSLRVLIKLKFKKYLPTFILKTFQVYKKYYKDHFKKQNI